MDGATIRLTRIERGLRSKDVAHELDVAPETYSRWEKGIVPRRVAYAMMYAIDRLVPPTHPHPNNDAAFAAIRALKSALENAHAPYVTRP